MIANFHGRGSVTNFSTNFSTRKPEMDSSWRGVVVLLQQLTATVSSRCTLALVVAVAKRQALHLRKSHKGVFQSSCVLPPPLARIASLTSSRTHPPMWCTLLFQVRTGAARYTPLSCWRCSSCGNPWSLRCRTQFLPRT